MPTRKSSAARPVASRDFVASLARGLDVIRAFGPAARDMNLSEVAAQVGISRAAARRALLTLAALGYVERDAARFKLTPKVLSLGYAFLSSQPFLEVADPHLKRLAENLDESSSMAVLDHDEIVYVARIPARKIMSVALGVGARLPAYCTSMGRVLLAHLSNDSLNGVLAGLELHARTRHTVTDANDLRQRILQVREHGYAIVDQELEEGLRSIAVAVRNGRGDVIAALNVGVHASRATAAQLKSRYLPLLLETADAISAALAV